MRKEFWEWFCTNAEQYNLYFISTDLWRFPVPDSIKDRVIDLMTSEDLTWPVAAGIARSGARVFVYGVSFFNIGRLESLRSEIIHADLDCYILNAGAYGYSKYGPSHSFHHEDDLKIMSSLGVQIINPTVDNNLEINNEPLYKVSWRKFAEGYKLFPSPVDVLSDQQVVYLRLGPDEQNSNS